MRELSLHIMDIVENGISAGADLIGIEIRDVPAENLLCITIRDNGRGIPEDLLEKVTDPFFTSRTTRRVGLGLSLFLVAARRCDGEFGISSKEGLGTTVTATFKRDHIDLAPMGDMEGTLTSLIMGSPHVDFVCLYEAEGRRFLLDTREIRKELEEVPMNHPQVLKYISETIREGLKELSGRV
ncbi:MAG: ATP-binding protein [Desulfatiglandales bacterium]